MEIGNGKGSLKTANGKQVRHFSWQIFLKTDHAHTKGLLSVFTHVPYSYGSMLSHIFGVKLNNPKIVFLRQFLRNVIKYYINTEQYQWALLKQGFKMSPGILFTNKTACSPDLSLQGQGLTQRCGLTHGSPQRHVSHRIPRHTCAKIYEAAFWGKRLETK